MFNICYEIKLFNKNSNSDIADFLIVRSNICLLRSLRSWEGNLFVHNNENYSKFRYYWACRKEARNFILLTEILPRFSFFPIYDLPYCHIGPLPVSVFNFFYWSTWLTAHFCFSWFKFSFLPSCFSFFSDLLISLDLIFLPGEHKVI